MVLLVVALLAILAGLMLPALAKAKAKAKRAGGPNWSELAALESAATATPPESFESYEHRAENPFQFVSNEPVSTFSIDVDTASYANIRRFLSLGQLPPPDAVRIEEMINTFAYSYPAPQDSHPFSVTLEASECPWNLQHRLVRLGLKARQVPPQERPPCNLVFLIDVSGSMDDPRKLPLVQHALELLVGQLADRDRVAIVVYAGASGLVLDSTDCRDRQAVLRAIRRLHAGGSTNGGQGIELAYQTAVRHLITGGINRVILCTDGDFNVGVTGAGDLARLIKEKARTGVFLTVLGFGMGNYKDATLERLADLGNGNYGYVDTLAEARKLLVEELSGTLVTVAKDVKIQIEFNPHQAAGYRLIGYENRMLRREDFNNDTKDAGEIGAGHTVTALYEIVPTGQPVPGSPSDPLKYQQPPSAAAGQADNRELFTVKLRYKAPDGTDSQLITIPFLDPGSRLGDASADFKFAAAVAAFGLILRDSEHKGSASPGLIRELAGPNPQPVARSEFLGMVRTAEELSTRTTAAR